MTHIKTDRLAELLEKFDRLDISDADYIQIGLLLKIFEALNNIRSDLPRIEK